MSDTSPSERMTSAFASLVQSSKNINDASNELAQPIASLEKSLKRLNLGVTCWTQVSSAGDGDTYFLREVGYAELQDRWCVALRTRRGRECDRNHYSIPHTHVRRPLTLVASATTVRLLDGQTELARHRRSYDTGQTIEDAGHLEGLLAATHQANVHTARDRLRVAVPATATLFEPTTPRLS